jgi:hypothetical protein
VWPRYTEPGPGSGPLPEAERNLETALYGVQLAGPRPDREPAPAPDLMALQYAAQLLSRERSLRLGLAAACRWANPLAAAAESLIARWAAHMSTLATPWPGIPHRPIHVTARRGVATWRTTVWKAR